MSNFFGTVNTQSTVIDAPVYEGYVAPTADAVMSIATEGVLEGLQLQAALHVADATIAYTAVHESAGAAEAVLESVVGNTIGKLKEGLKKLWAKIKAWFASVGKTFSLMFAKGKDFVKKYKKEILEKPSAGFEYSGHVWTVEAGNNKAGALIKSIDSTLQTVLKAASSIDAKDYKTADTTNAKDEFDLPSIKEDLVKKLGNTLGAGVDDMSEIKEKLQEVYRNGKDEKEEIKDFGKVSRGTLIDLIDKSDKSQKEVKDIEKEVDKQFNESLKALQKLETEIGKAKDSDFTGADNAAQAKSRGKITALASMVSNVTRYAQSLNTAIAGAAVENIKAAASEAESVLKQFIRYRGTKESFEGDDHGTENTSVLENLISNVQL